MDKREEEVQQNSVAGWGQECCSMWQQHCSICCCNIAAAVAMQHARASDSGEALLPAAVSISKHWHQVLAGLLQQVLPAVSDCFLKTTVVTATAVLLTTFINKK